MANGNGNGGGEPIHPTLHKLENESITAHSAFLFYVGMGPTRSYRALMRTFQQQKKDGGTPPSVHWNTISQWALKFDWQGRLEAHSNALADNLEKVRKEAVTHFINRALVTSDRLMDKLDEQIDQFERQRVRRSYQVDDPRDAAAPQEQRRQIRVIEREVNALELQRLSTTFARTIDKMLDVLGDNDTITIKGPADKIKGYIGISPDDWDEDEAGEEPGDNA